MELWRFSENGDELADLVKHGNKAAITSAYELYSPEDAVPKVDDYNIILDGSDRPVCITQTKVVYNTPYHLVSPEHAWHEGEGDRSYEYWKKVHDDFCTRQYKEYGKEFYEQAPVLCEVFEKVYYNNI